MSNSPAPHAASVFLGAAFGLAIGKPMVIWAGSVFPALFGVLTLLLSPPAVAEARRADCQLPTPAKAADNNPDVGKN